MAPDFAVPEACDALLPLQQSFSSWPRAATCHVIRDDSLAALLISVEVIRDGIENVKSVVADLMVERPTKAHEDEEAAWDKRLLDRLKRLDWVADADVRLREHGNLLTGEVYVIPQSTENVTTRYDELQALAHEVDWRFHDLALVFMDKL